MKEGDIVRVYGKFVREEKNGALLIQFPTVHGRINYSGVPKTIVELVSEKENKNEMGSATDYVSG